MTERFGPLVTLFGLRAGIERIRIDPRAVATLRETAGKGPLLYVLPQRSVLDTLALNAVLLANGLPLAVWAPRVATFWARPLREAWAAMRAWISGRHLLDPATPVRALAAGRPIVLFADDPPPAGGPDPFSLLGTAALLDPPVRLVPLMVVWDRRPVVDNAVRSFFTEAAVPGPLHRWWRLVSGADLWIQIGQPVELTRFARRVGSALLAQVVRRIMSRALRTEAKLVRGPRLLPHRTMRQLVLDTPPMRALAAREAKARGVSLARIQRRIVREYDRIAARFSWTIIRVLHVLLRPLWTRVFSGVDVPAEDIDRIRAAMRDGTAVLVPCHKSHFDYVLLSWVLYDHGLIVPHVVAGRNLAVWPVSVLLRGAGGFFVPRTFAGADPIVPAVFARYLRELVLQEYPVEFFIEGGRSRSGKLLPPKLGVLGMVLDAAAVRGHHREVTILPIALAYEQVAEERAYARELGGEATRAESLAQLARSRSVLRRRFGQVHLRVGTPLRCGPIVDASNGIAGWADRPEPDRRGVVAALGDRVIVAIGRATVVLPSSLVALALLAHDRRAIRDAELRQRVRRFDLLLAEAGLPRGPAMERIDVAIDHALDRFVTAGRIRRIADGAERVWDVDPDQRITLEFYKNQVLHALAPALIVSAVIRARLPSRFVADDLMADFRSLASRLRREFVLDPEIGLPDVLALGLAQLVRHGALSQDDVGYAVADAARIGEIHALVVPLLEAHRAVLAIGSAPLPRKEIPAAVLARRGELTAAGHVTRPESLSIVTLGNAVATLEEDGVLRADPDGRLRLDETASATALVALPAMLGR